VQEPGFLYAGVLSNAILRKELQTSQTLYLYYTCPILTPLFYSPPLKINSLLTQHQIATP
jgi:hypothetical protein